jgi:hypothetical protein
VVITKEMITLGTMFLMLMGIPAIALADIHSMSPSVTVGNSAPNIYYMAVGSASYDPTESSITKVNITIRVRDLNGIGDLDNSAVKLEVDDAATFSSAVAKYTNTSCIAVQDLSSTEREYYCETDMDYWDEPTTYSTKVTAGDQAGDVFNDTSTNAPTYAYTTLVATDINSLSVTFGSVTVGTLNNPATGNPTTIDNTGNADLYLNVTGANLVNGGNIFGVGNFSVDLDSNPTGEQVLTAISAKKTGASIARGSDGTPSPQEDLYWFADVPTGINPLTYTGTWTLTQYEQ